MFVLLPNEQLSQAPFDGTVGVRALADVRDAIYVPFQGLALGAHVTQLPHQDDVIAVVKSS